MPHSRTGTSEEWSHTFIQITDIHLDPLFRSDSPIQHKCHYHSSTSGRNSFWHWLAAWIDAPSFRKPKTVRVYGQARSGCDSPPDLVDATFEALKRDFSQGAVSPSLAFVLWTGDNSRHDRDEELRKQRIEVYEHNAEVVTRFINTFDTAKIPVIPSIGNWDVYPVSLLACSPNDPSLISLWSIWEPLFPLNDPNTSIAKETFLRFGFFARNVLSDTTQVLSLNTLSFFNENLLVSDCSPFKLRAFAKREWDLEHPGDAQLAWMEERFLDAREMAKKVILQGHVSPVGNSVQLYKDACYEWFVYFSGEYSDVIIGQYYGHINRDLVHIVSTRYARAGAINNTTSTNAASPIIVNPYRLTTMGPNTIKSFDIINWAVVGTIHTSSSIVPAFNPGYRVGTIAITPIDASEHQIRKSNSSHSLFLNVAIMEHETRYLDIAAANKEASMAQSKGKPTPPLIYTSSCNSKRDHGLPNLSPESFSQWIEKMQDSFPELQRNNDTRDLGRANEGARLLRRYTQCVETSLGVLQVQDLGDVGHSWPSTSLSLIFLIACIAILHRIKSKPVWSKSDISNDNEAQPLLQ
ncbi:Endopolyphosphatase [Chytriomyces hyalinus]|nr:Endopolyphosphatase [Chytriomyces hyalinus]